MSDLDFGDYTTIEQHRFGAENEMYLYKVIGALNSNAYVDVPIRCGATETLHDTIIPVVRCICCGIMETRVLKFAVSDLSPVEDSPWAHKQTKSRLQSDSQTA